MSSQQVTHVTIPKYNELKHSCQELRETYETKKPSIYRKRAWRDATFSCVQWCTVSEKVRLTNADHFHGTCGPVSHAGKSNLHEFHC